jgi:hypothetical protein
MRHRPNSFALAQSDLGSTNGPAYEREPHRWIECE